MDSTVQSSKVKSRPEITKRTVYIKSTLFSYKNGVLKIGIEPRRRYLEVDLKKYSWIPKDSDRIEGLIQLKRTYNSS